MEFEEVGSAIYAKRAKFDKTHSRQDIISTMHYNAFVANHFKNPKEMMLELPNEVNKELKKKQKQKQKRSSSRKAREMRAKMKSGELDPNRKRN